MFASNPEGRSISSLSWSGYIVPNDSGNSPIESINASWTVPEIKASGDGYSSAWIGIGGQLDKTLIQIGTEQDDIQDRGTYTAWYELLPDFAVTITNLKIAPGDMVTASISLVNYGTKQWSIQLVDTTTGQAFSRNVFYNSTRSSGEWIIERPIINHSLSDLADFGHITFSDCNINTTKALGNIAEFPYSENEMINSRDTKLTSVSLLADNGTSFTVSYLASK